MEKGSTTRGWTLDLIFNQTNICTKVRKFLNDIWIPAKDKLNIGNFSLTFCHKTCRNKRRTRT